MVIFFSKSTSGSIKYHRTKKKSRTLLNNAPQNQSLIDQARKDYRVRNAGLPQETYGKELGRTKCKLKMF